MRFLIKVCFWLGLVLVLLPQNADEATTGVASAGPQKVAQTAFAALGDFAGICERRPDICQSAGEILQALGIRAREGAAIAYSAIADARQDDAALETGSIAGTE